MKRLLFTFLTLILAFLGTSNAYADTVPHTMFDYTLGVTDFREYFDTPYTDAMACGIAIDDNGYGNPFYTHLIWSSGYWPGGNISGGICGNGLYLIGTSTGPRFSLFKMDTEKTESQLIWSEIINLNIETDSLVNYPYIDEPLIPSEYFGSWSATEWDNNPGGPLDITSILCGFDYQTQLCTKATSTMVGMYFALLSDRIGTDASENNGYNESVVMYFYYGGGDTITIAGNSNIYPFWLNGGSLGLISTSTPDIISCNPFSINIETAFLNPNFSLSVCLGEVGTWLIQPTDAVMNDFVGIKELIQTKPPFGYFIMLKDLMQNATTTGTATTSVSSITIPTYLQTYIFTPIKIGLASLIGFIGLVFLFRRLKHIQL